MNNAEAIKKIDAVGTNYAKYMPAMPTNYTNGYMQAVRDCKAQFYGIEDSEKNKQLNTCSNCGNRNVCEWNNGKVLSCSNWQKGVQ